MTRNDGDKYGSNRNETRRRLPVNMSIGGVGPPRVRRFIPKPLILVERMKARQLLLESSPHSVSEYCVDPGSLTRPAATPFSTHVTSPIRREPTRSSLSSDSQSSSVCILVSPRSAVVFGSGPTRPLSGVTLGNSSSSTDTFVAYSPCCVKRASSKVPLLVTEDYAGDVYLGVRTDPGNQSLSGTGTPAFIHSVAADFVQHNCQLNDIFEPALTSTPFASSRETTSDVPASTAFVPSIHYSQERSSKHPEDPNIMFPTSRAVDPPSASKDTYIVKLPNCSSAISAAPRAPLANAPNPALHLRRLSNRTASLSPTLVLDGVFALPQPSQSSSSRSRRTFQSFPEPRKPSSRRLLVDISNAAINPISSPPQPQPVTTSPSSRSQPGPESPRSKLAYVLNVHAKRPTMIRTHSKQLRVPPLVRGVPVSNDPRTRCEIEGLRVRRVVGLGRGAGIGAIDGDAGRTRGAIERVPLGSVGMVARLRARWETRGVRDCA